MAKALSDETRVRMLKLLLDRDICACEMQGAFPLSQSQISRDLNMLMEAGFLKRWHEGRCVVYTADRSNGSAYCRAILDAIAATPDDVELRDARLRLQGVIAQQVRKKRR